MVRHKFMDEKKSNSLETQIHTDKHKDRLKDTYRTLPWLEDGTHKQYDKKQHLIPF